MKLVIFKNLKLNYSFYFKFYFYIYPAILLTRSAYITVYVTTLTILGFVLLYIKKKKIKLILPDYLIFIFFLISIISTFINISNFNYITVLKAISDLRFALLYLIIRNLFFYRCIEIKPIFLVSIICTLFLSLDIFFQHYYGHDIFGYLPTIDFRYAGSFNDEAIAGSYIQKYSLLSILFIILINIEVFKKKILILVLNILGLGILMSLDRTPWIMYIFQLFIIVILIKKYKSNFLVGLLILLTLYVLVLKHNNLLNNKHNSIYLLTKNISEKITDNIHFSKKNNEKGFDNNKKDLHIYTQDYLNIFYSAYIVWKDSPLIGHGIKSFQVNCIKLSSFYKNMSCPLHPHNIYLEVIINTGIVGIIIFLIFLLNIFINLIKFYSKKNNSEKITLISTLFIAIFVSELWPLRSYGSIFTTVNGSTFWHLIALLSSIKYLRTN
jgi:hypothetical protein